MRTKPEDGSRPQKLIRSAIKGIDEEPVSSKNDFNNLVQLHVNQDLASPPALVDRDHVSSSSSSVKEIGEHVKTNVVNDDSDNVATATST